MSSIANSTTSIHIPSVTQSAVAPKSLLVSLLLGHGTVLLLMSVFGYDLSRLQSLLSVVFASFCGLMLLYALYARKAFGNTVIVIICLAFFIKVLTGVLHSLYFFDSSYFSSGLDFNYLRDFMWMEDKMKEASEYWRGNGFSMLPVSFYIETKNPLLLAYNGLLYYLSGDNYVNISPWNALHSLYVALIVGALALEAGASRVQARFALTLAAFQPFGFLSNIMWRDSVGQFWLLFGVYLLIVTRDKKYLWVITLPFACIFAWTQREPYVVAVLVLAAYLLIASIVQEKLKPTAKIAIVTILFACVWILPKYSSFLFARYEKGDQLTVSLLTFPLRIARALSGPFPWQQIFMDVDGALFMPPDFMQAVYNMTLILLVIPLALKMWKQTKKIDPSLFLAFWIFFMGVQAKGVHIGYISIGIILLIPLVCQVPSTKWFRTFILCFYGFLFANMLYGAVGLKGSGIVMSITGH